MAPRHSINRMPLFQRAVRARAPTAAGRQIANNTTLGLTVHVNSGLPANLRSRTDLNGDGQLNDGPIWVSRNSAQSAESLTAISRSSAGSGPAGGSTRASCR